MASVTILSSPYLYAPAFNDVVFTVTSPQNATCSFRYIADIYVAGSYATRLKQFPDLNGNAEFNIAAILRDYVSADNHNNLYGFTTNPNSIKDYVVKFGVEYDTSLTCDQPTTLFTNLTVTSTFYVFNGALQYRDWKQFNYSDYVAGTINSKFMTNMPAAPEANDINDMTKAEVMIVPNGEQVLNFLHTSNNVAVLDVVVEDQDGSYANFQITNTQTGTTTAQRLLSVGVGPNNLNGATLSSGSQPVISPTTKRYSLSLLNGVSGQVSRVMQFVIDRRHTLFGPKQFCFLNDFGAFDRYSFTLLDKTTTTTTHTEYVKLIGSYASGSWTYNIGDRARTVLNSTSVDNIAALSNWMSQAEGFWMKDLFTSTNVFVEDVGLVTSCLNWTTGTYWSIGSTTCIGEGMIVCDGGACGI